MLTLAFQSASMATAAEQPLGVVLVFLLSAAAAVSVLCRRLGVEAIPGYLIAGAVVGPHVLGLIQSETGAASVTQLATVLLLFTIGLQFDSSNFRRGMLSIVGIAIGSTVLYILMFWAVLVVLGVSPPPALALAMAGCSASTAITVRLLQQRRELHEVHGRVSMGFSILDDLTGVVMLSSFPLIAVWAGVVSAGDAAPSGGAAWADKALGVAKALGGLGALMGLGRVALPAVMLRVARLGSQETLLVCTAAIALVSAVWTDYIGFSPEMGAFVAGFMLAGTPLRHQISGQLGPTRDLLMAVFFTSVGLVIDPASVGRNLFTVFGLAAALMFIKMLTTGGCAWAAGMTARGSLLTGVYNVNAGEFTFVLMASAMGLGLVAQEQSALAAAVVAVTLIATPLLVAPVHALGSRLTRVPLAPWVRSNALRDVPASPTGGGDAARGAAPGEAAVAVPTGDASGEDRRKPRHVIIAGFGPGGRALADRLGIMGVSYSIVELNAATVTRQARLGRRVVFGDASNAEVLETAGLSEADAVIVTIPDDQATLRAIQVARQAAPDVFIGARMQFLSGKVQALSLGADEVTVVEVATAVALEKELLGALSKWMEKRERAAASGA